MPKGRKKQRTKKRPKYTVNALWTDSRNAHKVARMLIINFGVKLSKVSSTYTRIRVILVK